jgi:phosphoserine phosphatase
MVVKRSLYIFDLDGTLALIDHRLGKHVHHPEAIARCGKDTPNAPVVRIMQSLLYSGHECWIWSGRSDLVQEMTERWIRLHVLIGHYRIKMRMRPADDYRPDEVLKEEWLHSLAQLDRERLQGIFDDRNKVVAMWRRNGVPCFQVAEGDF